MMKRPDKLNKPDKPNRPDRPERPNRLKGLTAKCFVLLFLSISVLYSETVVRITANRASILDSPSYQGQVIGHARQGETYSLQGSQGEWYKILLPGGGTGWILAITGEIETGTPQPGKAIQRTPAPSYHYQTPAPIGPPKRKSRVPVWIGAPLAIGIGVAVGLTVAYLLSNL